MNKRLRIYISIVVLWLAAPLAQAQKPELVLQTGHSSVVTAIVISGDGKLIASGSPDKTVILWDADSGKQLRSFEGHTEFITSLALSPDASVLASGSTDDTIRLWEVKTGRQLRTLTGHANNITAIAFNPDGSLLVSASTDKTLKLWSVADGKLLRTFTGHSQIINAVAFSPDGKLLASAGDDQTARLWDPQSGKERATLAGHTNKVRGLAFSPDGKLLASASDDKTVKLWEVNSGKELRAFTGSNEEINRVAFGTDGKTLVSLSMSAIKFWDPQSGKETGAITERNLGAYSMALAGNANLLAIGSLDNTVKLWDIEAKKKLRTFRGYAYPARFIAFAPDGKTLASARLDGVRIWDAENGSNMRVIAPSFGASVRSIAFSPDNQTIALGSSFQKELASFPDNIKKQLGIEETFPTIKIYELRTGNLVRTIKAHEDAITALTFSPDGKLLASGSNDKTIRLFDAASGAELRALAGHTAAVTALAFRFDGKALASGSEDKTVKIWDVEAGKELLALPAHNDGVTSIAYSPDGSLLASGTFLVATLWDADSGKPLREFKGHTNMVNSVAFSADGKQLATAGFDNLVKLWDTESGAELQTLRGHSNTVLSVAFSPVDQLLASASSDARIRLWNLASGSEVASLVALGDQDWAVVTPDGRFDASAEGMKLMHWVVNTEALELEQLKERYYEPKLLAKLLGFTREPLRDVGAFTEVQLPPAVAYEWLEKGGTKLKIKLTNRGGGIGRVQVFVNDKEVVADARGANFDEAAKQATLIVDLSNSPLLTGKANQVRIVTWNADGYLSSRGARVVLMADNRAEPTAPPELFAVIGGISSYSSPALNLRFAAKDAEDFAKALEISAKGLFGADKIHINLLTSSSKDPAALPTKANFRKAFAAARRARPTDVLLVYMAGHGLSLQRGNDLYCYLTQDARSNDAASYQDAAVRAASTITSDELVEWIKQIPALKQIMILDTCAAGAAQAKLTEKRAVPGDQIRAIERLKDRTGFHVLMGSAADAVSYETNQFEQGLLTYALLQGMRGAALRDGEYVDVSRLFQFAADQVPQLAANIGGIQKPVIAAPRGTSFDFGLLKKADREAIPLTLPKQMVLRPVLLNGQQGYDNLDLTTLLRRQMINDSYASARGAARRPTIYLDVEELSGAVRPSGTYMTRGARVDVKMVLRKADRTLKSFRVSGSKNQLPALIERLSRALEQTLQNQPTPSQ